MNRSTKLVFTAISLAFLLPLQSIKALLTLNIDIPSVSIPFSFTDYNPTTGAAQRVLTSAQTLTIKSNSSTWTLAVRALTPTFSFVPSLGDPNPSKPAGNLSVRTPATSSTWLPLTTSNQILTTGPKAGPDQIRTLDYQLNSNLSTDPPGTYTLSVVYTLTSP
jgi:hypothetical protein